MNTKKETIAIIGGGASGLVAAIALARANKDVTIFEKNKKLGRKILATGNGRCNVTNQDINIRRYHGQNQNFASFVLEHFNTNDCICFFQSLGVELVQKANGRFYPMANEASSIVDAFTYELERLGVEIHLDTCIDEIDKIADKFLLHKGDAYYKFDKVVIASGGASMKKLGSSESGYGFAKSFGHNIVQIQPSLVQLITKESTKEIAGVKLEGSLNIIEKGISSYGDILFSPYGISGSASLDISRHIELDDSIFVDCMPSFSKSALTKLFQNSIMDSKDKPLSLWLHGFINKKLAQFILKKLKISSHKTTQTITKKEIKSIVYTLKNLQFQIESTKGFEFAEVTAGGVDTSEINPQTLESKFVNNLYFIGEILDVDGDCGGFNLHFAWGCGHIVARAICEN